MDRPHLEFIEPDLTLEQARALVAKYLEKGGEQKDRDALAAGDRLRTRLSVEDFQALVEWKTNNRGFTRLDKNTDAEVLDAIRLALDAKCPRSAIAVLIGLDGVGVPVASAIMTMLKPESHTVIDFRALETLGYKGDYSSISFYLRYLDYCTKLANKWGMSLRNLDRALWQWSKDKGASGQTKAAAGVEIGDGLG
jgi:hypothetical protein